MPITLEIAAINLVLAMVLGAMIGSERQVRGRMAGLRTNALVSLGAAGFVVFSALYPDEVSPTRVAAQVVSGIGFLGAGIIFRHGFTVHGLNTAATLWCSAAVGIMAGAGAWGFATLMTGVIVFVNLGLRPLVKWIKRKTGAGLALTQEYRIVLRMQVKHADSVSTLVMNKLSLPGFTVSEVAKDPVEDLLEMIIHLTVQDRDDTLLKAAVAPLLIDPRIQSLKWDAVEES